MIGGSTGSEPLSRIGDALSAVGGAWWEMDVPSGRVVFDRVKTDLLGYRFEDFQHYEDFTRLVHPDDLEPIMESMRALLKGRSDRYDGVYRIRSQKGEYLWFRDVGTITAADAQGVPLKVSGIVLDVTEMARAQLRAAQDGAILDSISEAVILTDREAIITFVNQTFCRETGFNKDDILGKSVTILRDPRQTDEAIGKIAEAVRQGSKHSSESLMTRKDGTPYWLGLSVTPLLDPLGKRQGSIFIARDLTVEVSLREHLVREQKKAEDASRAKGAFLASMSHELRTPLSAIVGFSQLLALDSATVSDEERGSFLRNIVESAKHLHGLIGDILDLSQIEAGKIDLQIAPLSLDSLVDFCFQNVADLARTNSIELVPAKAGPLGFLLGDETRIRQVLLNLLTNAIKFTPEGKRVGLTAEPRGAEVVLTVWDEGLGIAQEDLSRVFEPHEQVRGASLGREGVGLGLFISKTLVELSGGSIHLESQPGVGSRFEVVLPGRTDNCPLPHEPESSRAAAIGAAPFRTGSKILVVEDNSLNQELMKAILGHFHCEATVVGSGEAAIELDRTRPHDLILMDVNLPGMDGLQAARLIRLNRGTSVPIIALTGQVLEGDLERFLAAGMNDMLAKPFEISDLERILVRYLSGPSG